MISRVGCSNADMYFPSVAMGHQCKVVSNYERIMMGKAQVIEKIGDGADLVWGAGELLLS